MEYNSINALISMNRMLSSNSEYIKDDYKEILELSKMLKKENIPFELDAMFGGWHIQYPNEKDRICSAVEHDGSYGRGDDKIEIMGLLTEEESECDDVVGYLTAEDVFNRIKNDFDLKNKI